jgi:ribosomal protein L40E
MPDEVEPVVRGIQKRFRDLSVDVREERIIRYIVNQLSQGRHMDEILNDPYLTAHTTEVHRAQLLQNPAVIRAIEEEIHKQFAGYKTVTEGAAGNPPAETAETKENPDGAITCPSCGTRNAIDSNFCKRCGSRVLPIDPSEVTLVYSLGEHDTAAGADSAAVIISGTMLLIRAGGGREGEHIGLSGDVLTIGRSPHSDLFLDDVTVSRHHARIVRDENDFLVEDLNSLNGTYVNRKRIERHRLSDGDELQIGKFKLAFIGRDEQI